MRRIHLMFAALVVVAAMGLAACGGSSNKSSSKSSNGSGGSGNFCTLLKHDNNDKALNASPTNLADAKKLVQARKTAFDQLEVAAPSQIKSAMRTFQSFYNDLAKSVTSATNENDFTSKAKAVQSKHTAANSAAQQKVSTYAKQQCGISSGSGG